MTTQTRPGGTALDVWPALPYAEWKETCATLQMWTQIVGKVKLALTPFLNEWWNVAFHLTARGLTTGLIPYQERAFEVRFDFVDHNLFIETDEGASKALSFLPRTVAAFYGEVMGMLQALGITVAINPVPCEVPNPIPCDDDAHTSRRSNEPILALQSELCGRGTGRARLLRLHLPGAGRLQGGVCPPGGGALRPQARRVHPALRGRAPGR
jgi:hypothetical protein